MVARHSAACSEHCSATSSPQPLLPFLPLLPPGLAVVVAKEPPGGRAGRESSDGGGGGISDGGGPSPLLPPPTRATQPRPLPHATRCQPTSPARHAPPPGDAHPLRQCAVADRHPSTPVAPCRSPPTSSPSLPCPPPTGTPPADACPTAPVVDRSYPAAPVAARRSPHAASRSPLPTALVAPPCRACHRPESHPPHYNRNPL